MPELDGYDTCKQIRQQYSSDDLPIIFLTARNQLKDLVAAFDSGGNDYLSKPFFKDELLSRVHIQIELKIQRNRLTKLRQFANNISQYKSHEDMAKAAYEILSIDPLIGQASIFFDGEILFSSQADLFTYPDELQNSNNTTKEVELDNNGTVQLYQRLSSLYVLAASFPKSSSEEWLRMLAQQIKTSMEQVRRISSNPEITLLQTDIKPKLRQTLYIKVEKNYCLMFIEQGDTVKEIIHRIPFKQLMMHVEKNELLQVHRSIAINPAMISAVSKAKMTVTLGDSETVPVAKKYLAELLDVSQACM